MDGAPGRGRLSDTLDALDRDEAIAKPADPFDARALRERVGPRHDEFRSGECRPLLSETAWPEQALGNLAQLV
jgi:hypothetical protein